MTNIIVLSVSLLMSLLISYFIIKSAVSEANKELLRIMKMLVNLKAEEMKKNGASDDEISSIIRRVK